MYIQDQDIHGFKHNGKIYCKKCARYYQVDQKALMTEVITEQMLDRDDGEYFCDVCKAIIHERTKG